MAICPSSDGQIREGAEDKSLLQKEANGYFLISKRLFVYHSQGKGQTRSSEWAEYNVHTYI
jgi:hypothetical protein